MSADSARIDPTPPQEASGHAQRVLQALSDSATPSPAPDETPISLADRVARFERGLIEEALRSTRGNRARAARLLRTTQRILGYRVQQYGIDCSRFRDPSP